MFKLLTSFALMFEQRQLCKHNDAPGGPWPTRPFRRTPDCWDRGEDLTAHKIIYSGKNERPEA